MKLSIVLSVVVALAVGVASGFWIWKDGPEPKWDVPPTKERSVRASVSESSPSSSTVADLGAVSAPSFDFSELEAALRRNTEALERLTKHLEALEGQYKAATAGEISGDVVTPPTRGGASGVDSAAIAKTLEAVMASLNYEAVTDMINQAKNGLLHSVSNKLVEFATETGRQPSRFDEVPSVVEYFTWYKGAGRAWDFNQLSGSISFAHVSVDGYTGLQFTGMLTLSNRFVTVTADHSTLDENGDERYTVIKKFE